MNNAMNYRRQIEGEKWQIEAVQATPEGRTNTRLQRRLNEIVGELILLDAGEHWTQEGSDTAARIVTADLQRSSANKKTAS